jgi:CheY-like chemotaxis protein
MTPRKRLGEIFVEHGIITGKTVERILDRSKRLNLRVGTLLEEMGLVTGDELAAALASQYGCKVVSQLMGHAYAPELFQIIPAEVAMEHHLFPLRRDGNKLALAMADPTDTKVVENIAANNGLTIMPFIATKSEIYGAICRHYLGREQGGAEQKTVLIAEDDKVVLFMLSEILTKHGYRVVTAQDGIEAFKAVIAEKPHVIITDKVMPKLDGFGLFDALQKVPEVVFIPVILVTAGTNESDETRAFEKGFFDFIVKPVREATLLTRVKRAFIFHEHNYRYT